MVICGLEKFLVTVKRPIFVFLKLFDEENVVFTQRPN